MNGLPVKIGAIFYVIWGLVHINAAYALLKLGQSVDPSLVQARVFQDAWNILVGAIAVIIVGVTMNWHNSRTGFWINLTVVSLLDIPFVLFVIVPGYAPLWPGLQGPIAWAIAAVFSAVGLAGRKAGAERAHATARA
jgi:hypothetical protein